MNVKPKNPAAVHIWILLGASLLAAEGVAGTQSVIFTPPPADITPSALQADQANNAMDVFTPAGTLGSKLTQLLQYGPVTLHPHVSYRFLYGNGIQSQPGSQQNTVIQEVSPGILLDLGTHWALDYTPTLRYYSNSQFHDGVDHAATLTGWTRYEDWTLGLSQGFACTTAPTVETGAQTEQQNYSTALFANYAFSSRMSADFGLNQSLNFVSGFQDSRTWSTMDWLNYHFGPRLNVGIGAGAGYVNITDSAVGYNNPDQTYEQLQGRINWRATDKISFQVNGGFEDRQIQASGVSATLNPIYGASVQYLPFKDTQISLAANRSVSASDYYVAAQTSENTSVNLGLNQRLLKKFNLNLGAGYTQSDYTDSLGSKPGVNRTDESYSFNASLSHPFFRRGTWSLSYQYSDNVSSQSGFGYQSSQIGFSISYAY